MKKRVRQEKRKPQGSESFVADFGQGQVEPGTVQSPDRFVAPSQISW
jgi:hypothetical protein